VGRLHISFAPASFGLPPKAPGHTEITEDLDYSVGSVISVCSVVYLTQPGLTAVAGKKEFPHNPSYKIGINSI
jgi:hypothetical protein